MFCSRQIKSALWLLALFLFFSCRSINHMEQSWPRSLVYLSFDDGPNSYGDTTGGVLDVLARYRIRALFCLLGENAEREPDLVRRIHDEGHYIVNHGYSDKWARNMNKEEFHDNLLRGEAAISSALGKELHPKLYRPQGGFYTSGHEKIWRDAGYTLVFGNIRIYDAVLNEANKDKAVKRVIEKVENRGGGIILLHDGRDSLLNMEKELEKNPRGAYNRAWIPEALEKIIIALHDKGFVLTGSDILMDLLGE